MPKNKDTKNDEKPPFENAALGFFFKSYVNRDPNKRKIKPVESILSFNADLNLDDSESDDSDYKPTNIDDVDIESDVEDEDGAKSGKKKNGTDNNAGTNDKGDEDDDSDSDEDDDDSSSDEEDDETEDTKLKTNGTNELKNVKLENEIDASQLTNTNIDSVLNNAKKILICSVCLGEVSRNEDEIVECDACGISVHELCYGITADDAESVHSNASSASTEPWFCDPCKAGVKNPLCELCPNRGGIYKITDAGRWVHMVCALYTHGITFADVEKLRGPALSEINCNRWGAKNCVLCVDQRFCHTGVCISCDAGMCKTFFHVSCAQREGLLCELQHTDEVDPYIAYCRLHSDRNSAKKKRRNYLALAAKNRLMAAKNLKNGLHIEDSITNQRTLSKLFLQREKFLKNFLEIGNMSSMPPKRIPKLLDTSPSVIRRLSTKGELLGYNCSQSSHLEELTDIRRKWYIQPAFSVEFVSYYIDRSDRIASMQKQSQELIKQNKQLKEIEATVRVKYDNILSNTDRIKAENESIRSKIREYLSIIGSFTNKSNEKMNDISLSSKGDDKTKMFRLAQSILSLPEMQSRSTQATPSTSSSLLSNGASSSGLNHRDKGGKTLLANSTEGNRPKLIQIKNCATCSQTKDQHLLALCDSCHLYYHLYCLDPPLRRMPKKTRFGGWQCSNCTEKDDQSEPDELSSSKTSDQETTLNNTISSIDSGSSVNTETINNASTCSRSATRKLRENPKAPTKFEHDEHLNALSIIPCSSSTIKKRSRRKISPNSNSTSRRRSRKPPISQSAPTNRKRRLSSSQERITDEAPPTVTLNLNNISNSEPGKLVPLKRSLVPECSRCKKEAQLKLSVRCDNCENIYHFGCLIPPCTKNPKRRGYTWCCYICEKKGDKRNDHSHSEEVKEEIMDEDQQDEVEIAIAPSTEKTANESESDEKVVPIADTLPDNSSENTSDNATVTSKDNNSANNVVVQPNCIDEAPVMETQPVNEELKEEKIVTESSQPELMQIEDFTLTEETKKQMPEIITPPQSTNDDVASNLNDSTTIPPTTSSTIETVEPIISDQTQPNELS